MQASERVRVIRAVVDELQANDNTTVDLIFHEFRIPVPHLEENEEFDNWKDYLSKRCRLASNDSLIAVATHLGVDTGNLVGSIPSSFWTEGYLKVFISHVSTEKDTAEAVKKSLDWYGISGFVAHSDIEPTKEWQHEIELALRTCDALVALMSDKFHESYWTDQEVGFVHGRNIPIVPVQMGQLPYGFIAKYQALPFHADADELSKRIVSTLLRNRLTESTFADILINTFKSAQSFYHSKVMISMLQTIKTWNPDRIELMRQSLNNSQVSQSYGVPEKVREIINKFSG